MAGPKKNVAYEFDIALVDSASPGSFKAAPTIAAGDFKVSTANGAFANLTTLPSVDPAGSIAVKINLSASEMNGDKIMVQCIDAAGAEWNDKFIFIDAPAVTVEDLVRATTPANTLDVDASGEVTVGANNDKTGYALSAAGVDAIFAKVYEGTTTFLQYLRLSAAPLWGKLSGATTTTVAIRDEADSKDRIVATVDSAGNRTAVTLDKT